MATKSWRNRKNRQQRALQALADEHSLHVVVCKPELPGWQWEIYNDSHFHGNDVPFYVDTFPEAKAMLVCWAGNRASNLAAERFAPALKEGRCRAVGCTDDTVSSLSASGGPQFCALHLQPQFWRYCWECGSLVGFDWTGALSDNPDEVTCTACEQARYQRVS